MTALPRNAAAPSVQSAPTTGRTALVVDDSAAQRMLLTAALKSWGYHVRQASGGMQALELCRSEPVDLVLSDWMMPGMSGVEFCRAFRQLNHENYGYFILLTSKSDKTAVACGLDAGADDFLSKPVNPAELRARIRAGERILHMERELTRKNRLVSDTLARLQTVYDSLDHDLVQARALQQSLLRENHRRFGTASVSLLLHPSGHVGGDLVGFFQIDARRIGLYAFDVSGHGVTSALLSARLAGLFPAAAPAQNLALSHCANGVVRPRDPAEVAARINRVLLDEIRTDHYCTLAYAEADLGSGRLRLVQAGHPHPLVQRADGRVERLGSGGLPLGLLADAQHDGFECQLAPGDRLILMSDGIEECPDPDGSELGEARLHALLYRLRDYRGEAFSGALVKALAAHSGTSDFPDDVSCCILERDPPAD